MVTAATAILGAAFILLGVVGVVLHLRVVRAVRPGAFFEFRRAMRWQNYDLAETFIEPSGKPDMQRLRLVSKGLMGVMVGAALVMFVLLLLGGPPRTR